METVRLGSTEMVVCKNGFGCLPIQRIEQEDAVFILRKAYEGGINFFDTARAYSDSELKLGEAVEGFREKIFIATKTNKRTVEEFWADLEESLRCLKTDYIDLYQFHNPPFCPKLGDGTGLYEAMLQAKREGKIRHIGITNHRLHVANEAIDCGLYETLQFPFSYISGEQELNLVKRCKENDMGFIAMKGLSGGLLNNAKACYAFEAQFDNVLPIWGIQREKELKEWLAFHENPATMDAEISKIIEEDRKELSGEFCRGCGYCLPCPMGIKINDCARMIQMIRRSPSKKFLSEDSQRTMLNIENCLHCGKCVERCPYELPIPTLLEKNLKDYKEILAGNVDVSLTVDARD